MKTLISAIQSILFSNNSVQQEIPENEIQYGERPHADPQPGCAGK